MINVISIWFFIEIYCHSHIFSSIHLKLFFVQTWAYFKLGCVEIELGHTSNFLLKYAQVLALELAKLGHTIILKTWAYFKLGCVEIEAY